VILIPFGGTGTGKSNVLNKLIGDNKFSSSESAATGETKTITHYNGPLIGTIGAGKKVHLSVYDLPGVGDFEIPLC
jgi:GTP-binding protein EngB required for normal cell division